MPWPWLANLPPCLLRRLSGRSAPVQLDLYRKGKSQHSLFLGARGFKLYLCLIILLLLESTDYLALKTRKTRCRHAPPEYCNLEQSFKVSLIFLLMFPFCCVPAILVCVFFFPSGIVTDHATSMEGTSTTGLQQIQLFQSHVRLHSYISSDIHLRNLNRALLDSTYCLHVKHA